jgi:hypothetical protein
MTPEQIARFWKNVCKTPGGCWVWTGGQFTNGYGGMTVDGKALHVHRLSWELSRGPIPQEMCVLHKCDVRLCVNPDHLFTGTQGDNIADKVLKGRVPRGSDAPVHRRKAGTVPKLPVRPTDIEKLAMFEMRLQGFTRQQVAKRFNVSPCTVSRCWKLSGDRKGNGGISHA